MKVAAIMGSGRGIGAAIASRLVQDGWCVVVNYRRDALSARCLAKKFAGRDCRCILFRGDVRTNHGAEGIIGAAIQQWGQLDALVHCAHEPFVASSVAEMQWADVEEQLTGTLKPALLCTKAALPHLKRTRGAILNISSVTVGTCEDGFAARDVAKAALEQFTRSAAKELATCGVRVNALSVGWTQTDQLLTIPMHVQKKKQSEIPLRRFASPEEIAETAAFFLSSSASYVTGVVFPVTGGLDSRIR